ncbi:hypothetical protein ACFL4S_01155 [bacterium]
MFLINFLIIIISIIMGYIIRYNINDVINSFLIGLIVVFILSLYLTRKKVIKKLLDTDVLIDGRIIDICELKFIRGIFLVPGFVTAELKTMLKSRNNIERSKAEKGLDVLQRLKKCKGIDVKTVNKNYKKYRKEDKMLNIAKHYKAQLVTMDLNTIKEARLKKIDVLDIKELANSLGAVAVPGEKIYLYLMKPGRVRHEAISYLEDGSMVVVEYGKQYVGQKVEVLITKTKVHAKGRIIFAKLIGPVE